MEYIKQDITEINSGILVHSVNTQGVAGSGVAYALKKKWPEAFDLYFALCKTNKNNSGNLLGQVVIAGIKQYPSLYVIHLFGQQYYGNDGATYANPIAITQGLTKVFAFAQEKQLPIYSAKIGAKRGGLDWTKDVEPTFIQLETQYPDVDTYICEYEG